jgi:uncharacterized protein (TIGR02001 family)
MNKIFLTALAGALSVGLLDARAQSGANVNAPTVTANVTTVSQYMFRGKRLGGVSLQPSLELGGMVGGAMTLGIWANKPIANRVVDVSDPEIDFYGSYSVTMAEGLSLVPGFTYYYYPNLINTVHKATFEPNIAINYTLSGVKLTPKVYYDFMYKGATWEIAGAHSVALANLGLTVDLSASFGTFKLTDVVKDASPKVKHWGNYWTVGLSVPFQISPNSKLTLGWTYAEGWQHKLKQGAAAMYTDPLQAARGVVSVNYSFSF